MTTPEAPSNQPTPTRQQPRWQLSIYPDGALAARTEGLTPPLIVVGDTLASLRRQAREQTRERIMDLRHEPGRSRRR